MIWMLWFCVVMAAIATYHDLRTREIPDWISIVLLLAGIVRTALDPSVVGWTSLVLGVAMALVGGWLLYRFMEFGGGDVKLMAGIAAVTGYRLLWVAVVGTFLAGGVLGLVAMARGKRDLAYGPAILAGVILLAAWATGVSAMRKAHHGQGMEFTKGHERALRSR